MSSLAAPPRPDDRDRLERCLENSKAALLIYDTISFMGEKDDLAASSRATAHPSDARAEPGSGRARGVRTARGYARERQTIENNIAYLQALQTTRVIKQNVGEYRILMAFVRALTRLYCQLCEHATKSGCTRQAAFGLLEARVKEAFPATPSREMSSDEAFRRVANRVLARVLRQDRHLVREALDARDGARAVPDGAWSRLPRGSIASPSRFLGYDSMLQSARKAGRNAGTDGGAGLGSDGRGRSVFSLQAHARVRPRETRSEFTARPRRAAADDPSAKSLSAASDSCLAIPRSADRCATLTSLARLLLRATSCSGRDQIARFALGDLLKLHTVRAVLSSWLRVWVTNAASLKSGERQEAQRFRALLTEQQNYIKIASAVVDCIKHFWE